MKELLHPQVVTQASATVSGFLGMIISDLYGRRNVTIIGTLLIAASLCIFGGIGTIIGNGHNANGNLVNTMVAFIILYVCIMSMSIGPVSYIVGAEVGTGTLREKTLGLGTAMNVVSSFVVVCELFDSNFKSIILTA